MMNIESMVEHFLIYYMKNENMEEMFSKKAKQACSFIRKFRVQKL